MYPFIKWFWLPKKTFNFRSESNKVWKEYKMLQEEYDNRLSYFENNLTQSQKEAYMDLRICAGRLVQTHDRLDFLMEYREALK